MPEHSPDQSSRQSETLNVQLNAASLASLRLFESACCQLARRLDLTPLNLRSHAETIDLGVINGLILNAVGIKPLLELPDRFSPHLDFIAETFGVQIAPLPLAFNKSKERFHGINNAAVLEAIDSHYELRRFSSQSAVSACRLLNALGEDSPEWHTQYGLLMGFPPVATAFFEQFTIQHSGLHWNVVLTKAGFEDERLFEVAETLFDSKIPLPSRVEQFQQILSIVGPQVDGDMQASVRRFKLAQEMRSFGAGSFVWSDRIDSQDSIELENKVRLLLDATQFYYTIPHRYFSTGKPTIISPPTG